MGNKKYTIFYPISSSKTFPNHLIYGLRIFFFPRLLQTLLKDCDFSIIDIRVRERQNRPTKTRDSIFFSDTRVHRAPSKSNLAQLVFCGFLAITERFQNGRKLGCNTADIRSRQLPLYRVHRQRAVPGVRPQTQQLPVRAAPEPDDLLWVWPSLWHRAAFF